MPSTHPQISQIADPHRLQYIFMNRAFRGPRNPGFIFFDGNPLNLSQPKPGVLARNLAKALPLLYKLVPIDPKTGVPLDPELRKAWLLHLIKESKLLENGEEPTSIPLELPPADESAQAEMALAEPPVAGAAPDPDPPSSTAAVDPLVEDQREDRAASAEPSAESAGEEYAEQDEDSEADDATGEGILNDSAVQSAEDLGKTSHDQAADLPQRLSKKAKKQRKKAVVGALKASADSDRAPPAADVLPPPRQRALPTTSGQAAFAASLAADTVGR